jgi:hypothetical protein
MEAVISQNEMSFRYTLLSMKSSRRRLLAIDGKAAAG